MKRKKNLLVLDAGVGKVNRRYRGMVTVEDVRRKIALYAGAAFVGVLMLVLVIWGVTSVVTEIIAPDRQTAVYSAEDAIYGEQDALVLLALKLNDEHTSPENIVLTRFEPSESRVYVCPLPTDALYDGKTLKRHFEEGGKDGIASAVAGLVDCSEINTVSVDFVQLRKVINFFGGVTITVPYYINYESPKGDRNINAAAGTRVYTGWEAARLLNYPGWEGGEREHTGMYAKMVAMLIDENLDCEDSDGLKYILSGLYDHADVDITQSQLYQRTKGLLHLCSVNRQTEGELTVFVDVWTSVTAGEGSMYTEDDLLLLQAAFGRREA